MKKSLERYSSFQATSVPAKATTPVSSVSSEEMPSTPRCREMPFSPRKPTFSIQAHCSCICRISPFAW